MFWVLLLLAAALGAAYYRWSRRRLHRLAREIPSGLKQYPLLGHAHMFLGSDQDRINAIQNMGRVANRQGGLASLWLTHRLYIDMTDPEDIEVVTKNCLEKDDFIFKFIRTVIGNGSIFAPVNIWHPRRKIMTPYFSLKNLNLLMPVFQKKSSLMVDLMRSELGGGDFPIWKYMTTYTFDTIFENAFGIHLNSQYNTDHEVLQIMDELMHVVAQRMLQPWLYPDFIYRRLPVYKKFQSLRQNIYSFAEEIVQSARNTLKTIEPNDSTGWKNFIDMIIQTSGRHGKTYSDIELYEEFMVLVAAANDTTATCLSFTSVLLSRYPDVQDRVHKELQEVIGDSNRDVTREDLLRLKYLEAVIKESLRLYPPGPLIAREVHNDTKLPSGTTLVDGTGVMINIWGTHRNPSYWGADAELFRPERFLEGPLRHPAQFIPFSYSVRNCVGSTYAMMAMKTALSNLLRQYRLLPPANMAAADLTKPLRVEYSIMMKPTDNFLVRIEERNKLT